jgi:hypothetical protein
MKRTQAWQRDIAIILLGLLAASCSKSNATQVKAKIDSGVEHTDGGKVGQAVGGKVGATLEVNDTDAVGVLADGSLSLAEAIRLGNGDLALDALSADERHQVSGTPGHDVADTIRLVVGEGTLITAPAANTLSSAIPTMLGNDGDVVDGGGAVLTEAAPKSLGLIVASSNVTVKNLEVRAFNAGVLVDPLSNTIENVTIDNVTFVEMGEAQFRAGATKSGGVLRNLTVTNCTFRALTSTYISASIAAAAPFPGETVENTLAENIVFSHNHVTSGLWGLYVFAAASRGGTARHAVTKHVTIDDNDFEAVGDASLNLSGANGDDVVIEDAVLEDVHITNNRIDPSNFGIGIWGGEPFIGKSNNDAHVRDLVIENNMLEARPGRSVNWCILLEAGRSDLQPATANRNSIERVQIRKNTLVGCQDAVAMTAGVVLSVGEASDNQINDVTIADNMIKDNAVAVHLRGGATLSASGSGQRTMSGNSVDKVAVTGNMFVNNKLILRVAGGQADAAGDMVSNNSVGADLTFSDNTYQDNADTCIVEENLGEATGNHVLASCGVLDGP